MESEVTKKVEEGVNAIAGINALTSRSYESQSVVIVEFQLSVDGRKAAEDVRERIAAIRPTFRDEVDEPRVLRFDPASRAIWSVAVLPADKGAQVGMTPVELTSWADQVLKKRLENVRGVGSVTLVGGTKREINIYLNPQALEGAGRHRRAGGQRGAHTRTKTCRWARCVRWNKSVWCRWSRACSGPKTSARSSSPARTVRRQGAIRLEQVARGGRRRAGGGKPGALQRPAHAGAAGAKNPRRQHHCRDRWLEESHCRHHPQLPPGLRLEPISDGSRPIRVAVDNVRRTLVEGAVLTVLIVFLFLNSWRSTVITGLTLPIAIIGTFLFMYMFGFTVNMITLMALSLCVGLLIDDAIVVRENIVRHVQMGKTPYAAAMEGTQEIGLAVLATTFSIVAVFLPIGFMGGIIGKFFHEFGITIVAAVLISMFVSFTLDPMLSSIWHDPAIDSHGKHGPPVTWYDKTIGRVTSAFDRGTERLSDGYQRLLRWSLGHKLLTVGMAVAVFVTSLFMVPLLGTEFVPKADFSETSLSFYTPVGSSIEVTEAKARQVDAILHEFPEVKYTLATVNTGNAQGKIYASCLHPAGRRATSAAAVWTRCPTCCATGCARWPASPSPTWVCSTRWVGKNRSSSLCKAPT